MSAHSKTFLDELREPQPNPGGGAAAAYGACLGLALLEKIIRLEKNRRPANSEAGLSWADLLERSRQLTADFTSLQQQDVQAYSGLVAARTPGSDKDQLDAALEEAIRCPVAIIHKSLAAQNLIARAGKHCKRHLLADLQVACELLEAAGTGAYHIALANLHWVKDAARRNNHRDLLGELRDQVRETRKRVNEELFSRSTAE